MEFPGQMNLVVVVDCQYTNPGLHEHDNMLTWQAIGTDDLVEPDFDKGVDIDISGLSDRPGAMRFHRVNSV